jgi:hypothetical protein
MNSSASRTPRARGRRAGASGRSRPRRRPPGTGTTRRGRRPCRRDEVAVLVVPVGSPWPCQVSPSLSTQVGSGPARTAGSPTRTASPAAAGPGIGSLPGAVAPQEKNAFLSLSSESWKTLAVPSMMFWIPMSVDMYGWSGGPLRSTVARTWPLGDGRVLAQVAAEEAERVADVTEPAQDLLGVRLERAAGGAVPHPVGVGDDAEHAAADSSERLCGGVEGLGRRAQRLGSVRSMRSMICSGVRPVNRPASGPCSGSRRRPRARGGRRRRRPATCCRARCSSAPSRTRTPRRDRSPEWPRGRRPRRDHLVGRCFQAAGEVGQDLGSLGQRVDVDVYVAGGRAVLAAIGFRSSHVRPPQVRPRTGPTPPGVLEPQR